MYTLKQEKRGLCPYDDKRYLLADLPDGTPNPQTHAYGHKDLAAEVEFEADMPELPGTDIIIEHREERFKNKHARVAKKLRAMATDPELDEEELEIPGDLAEAGNWEEAERAAAERPGVDGRIGSVIERLIAQGCGRRTPTPPPVYIDVRQHAQSSETNLSDSNELPVFPEISQRAGPSGTNHPDPNARRAQVDSSDEDDEPPPRQVWPPPARSRKRRNPFILDEAEAEDAGTCSDNNEDDDQEDGTYDGFYVNDDICD